MNRLSDATLASLPVDVERPGYDRAKIRIGVVHLGIGAFHRAHQATIFDRAIAMGDLQWGILGVSLRSAGGRHQLEPQDGLYTLVTRDASREAERIIGAIRGVIAAPDDPQSVIDALASPDVHIVTLTVTEKGYRPGASTSVAAPGTAIEFLVAGLAARRAAGLRPFTAISCDNLAHNGDVLRNAVLAVAKVHDPALADWIAEEGAFPKTMVDRFVPATTPDDIAALALRLGVEDRGMVKTELFLQWVIEDRFCGPRPDFEALGVRIAEDVAPWEEAKLRLLNGAHSAIAYVGGLAGVAFVHEFVENPARRAFIEALWDESEATLSPPPGLDVAAYRSALMARFANPSLQHSTRQIAMDGSQKLPQRLLAPAMILRARNQPFDHLALAIAAWMRWQLGRDLAGHAFAVEDPLATITARALAERTTSVDQVDALLAIRSIFPPEIGSDHVFRTALIDAFKRGSLSLPSLTRSSEDRDPESTILGRTL